MRVLAGVALAAGLQGMTQAAQAAPKVAGTYASMNWHLCQTKLVGHGNFPTVPYHDLDWTAGPNRAGIMSMSISTITFPAAPTSSGQATQNGIEVLGHTMRDDNPMNNPPIPTTQMERHVMQGTVPFTLTDTTLTAGDEVFDIVTAQNQRGIVTSMYMLRRPGPNEYCIDALQLIKSDVTGFGNRPDDAQGKDDDDAH
jgi:hypothetical protein